MYIVRSLEFTLPQTVHVCRQGIICMQQEQHAFYFMGLSPLSPPLSLLPLTLSISYLEDAVFNLWTSLSLSLSLSLHPLHATSFQ